MTSETRSLLGFAERAQAFLDAAAAATGLSDFGSDDFREAYGRFLAALDEEGRLNERGAAATQDQIELLLRCRLKTVQAWKDNPGYAQRSIERPLIITGIVRSGTTALHRLLAVDPQFQGTDTG